MACPADTTLSETNMSVKVVIPWKITVIIGGIRGTVVARWTAGKQVEQSILHHLDMIQNNILSFAHLSPAQYSITSADSLPETPFN